MRFGRIGLLCAAVALTATIGVTALAQGAAGGAGGGQGRGQGRRGAGFGQVTLAQVPVDMLASSLKLSDEQKTKVAKIHDKLTDDMKALQPAPADAGAQPDPQAMRERFQKIRDLNDQANKDIEAVLTDEQKPKAQDLVKELQSLTSVGIPIGVLPDLKLTDEEKKKIAAISKEAQDNLTQKMQEAQQARQDGDQDKARQIMTDARTIRTGAHDKVVALLTQEQKDTLDKYVKEHPQPQGFGGGRRGGAAANPPANP